MTITILQFPALEDLARQLQSYLDPDTPTHDTFPPNVTECLNAILAIRLGIEELTSYENDVVLFNEWLGDELDRLLMRQLPHLSPVLVVRHIEIMGRDAVLIYS